MIQPDTKRNNSVFVCGPTASGKTRLAVILAHRFNGEIISADSRQVYRGMDIGTGKDLHEYQCGEKRLPVHLIDIVNPSEVYTVYQFKNDCYRIFSEITARGMLPIVCGGTGLYIESVIRNYAIPAIPENTQFREQHMLHDKEFLTSELLSISPDLHARTDLSSKKRIVRALEIAYTYSHTRDTPPEGSPLRALVLCIRWNRAELHKRIDLRLEQRLEHGMVNEVERLLDAGVSVQRLVQLGMEYKHIVRFLNKEESFDDMILALKRDIHQLAKRQETWFRGMERRGIALHWIENGDADNAILIVEKNLSSVI